MRRIDCDCDFCEQSRRLDRLLAIKDGAEYDWEGWSTPFETLLLKCEIKSLKERIEKLVWFDVGCILGFVVLSVVFVIGG